jgi:hypothetical protein
MSENFRFAAKAPSTWAAVIMTILPVWWKFPTGIYCYFLFPTISACS